MRAVVAVGELAKKIGVLVHQPLQLIGFDPESAVSPDHQTIAIDGEKAFQLFDRPWICLHVNTERRMVGGGEGQQAPHEG
jgi:hypothetical protein